MIWPSEQQRTASISTAKTLSLAMTARRRRSSIAGAASAWRAWKARRRSSWLCFSCSEERCSATAGSAGGSGLRKVLTPTIG